MSITAVVMLLCQSTALAGTCAGRAAEPAAVMAHSPCHDAGGNDAQGPARDAHPAQCLSQATSSSPAFPDVPLLTGLSALVVRAAALRIETAPLPVFVRSTPPGEPPPISILHCCLRN